MKISFLIQLVISVIIGFVSSFMYGALVNGSIGSIGLTLIMISTFIIGKFIGEIGYRLDNINSLDINESKDLKK